MITIHIQNFVLFENRMIRNVPILSIEFLLKSNTRLPELEYMFTHSLTREETYNSLLNIPLHRTKY
jgi:hypothetical protein